MSAIISFGARTAYVLKPSVGHEVLAAISFSPLIVQLKCCQMLHLARACVSPSDPMILFQKLAVLPG